jgi:hypothetical protein
MPTESAPRYYRIHSRFIDQPLPCRPAATPPAATTASGEPSGPGATTPAPGGSPPSAPCFGWGAASSPALQRDKVELLIAAAGAIQALAAHLAEYVPPATTQRLAELSQRLLDWAEEGQ